MSTWYELRIVVAADEEDLASAALFDLEPNGLRTEADGDTRVVLCGYFPAAIDAESVVAALAAFGVTPAQLRLLPVPADDLDWSENWKLHFSPRAVGDRFYVCPPWSPNAPDGRVPLVVNPAMAFGTGQHATTRGCMVLIEDKCRRDPVRFAADLGTGSGILAIALARLGVERIVAADNDVAARESAAENLHLNGVEDRVVIGSTIDDIAGPVDLFVANLFADLLIELAEPIIERCAPRATVILSGMLDADRERVVDRFAALGWQTQRTWTESPWVAIALTRSAT